MAAPAAVRRGIVEICGRLYDRGLIVGAEGNVSVRLATDRVLITPAGVAKVDLRPADLVEVDLSGRPRGRRRYPSSEQAVHLRIYSLRKDVRAVVHAHPPLATGFAVAGMVPDPNVLPEVMVQLGAIALVPYETPGTAALAERLGPFAGAHDVFLLANHGAVTIGPTLTLAHHRMESLEHAARILLAARLVGRVNELSSAAVEALTGRPSRAAGPEHRSGQPAHPRRSE